MDLTRGNAGGAGAGAVRGGARAADRGAEAGGRGGPRAGPAGCGSPARGRLPDPSPFAGCPLPSPRALLRAWGAVRAGETRAGLGAPGVPRGCRRVPARPEAAEAVVEAAGGCRRGERPHPAFPAPEPKRDLLGLRCPPARVLLAHRPGDAIGGHSAGKPRAAIAAQRPRRAASLPPSRRRAGPGRAAGTRLAGAAPSPRPQVHCLPSAASADVFTPRELRAPGVCVSEPHPAPGPRLCVRSPHRERRTGSRRRLGSCGRGFPAAAAVSRVRCPRREVHVTAARAFLERSLCTIGFPSEICKTRRGVKKRPWTLYPILQNHF